MSRSFCFVTLFAATLTLAASTVVFAQKSDPAALPQRRADAINRGDVAGALAVYADDAVIDGVGLCAAAPCVGKAAIQKELERQVTTKQHYTILKTYVSGNIVTYRLEVRNDAIQKAGVERIIQWGIFETKGDKISSAHIGISERTDPQTARYAEWQRAQPPAR